ncbi:MAG: 16S rRNA (guanine(527)-N(7))-methyltransferase RsmG [Actinomycetota bacterium]
MKHGPDLAEFAEGIGVSLSPEQVSLLLRFEELLVARGPSLGLISSGDVERVRERHIMDSLRCALVIGEAREGYDLGSGGGLPGIVLSIARPDVSVALVESRSRKAAFLELAKDELGLDRVDVIHARAESLTVPRAFCLARAFSSLEDSWEVARPLLVPEGTLVYFAGRGWERPASPPPGALDLGVRETSVLESGGPLVIMRRL